jgi:hypothetical protein
MLVPRPPRGVAIGKGWFVDPMSLTSIDNADQPLGSLDGTGAGDHDQPYRFGLRPRASAPYPFSTRQYARLLVLCGRTRDLGGVVDLDGRRFPGLGGLAA